MELAILQADDTLTHIALNGRLDLEGVRAVEQTFVFNTTARRTPVLVDLSQVDFIASLGIGMLVGVAKALHRRGVDFILVEPTALVRATLEMAGVGNMIPILGDVTAARARLASPKHAAP